MKYDAKQIAEKFRDFGYLVHGERVAVMRAATKEKVGSLYIPDNAKRLASFGTIVALGRDVTFELFVGDEISVDKYTPSVINVKLGDAEDDAVELCLLHQLDVRMSWPGAFKFERPLDIEVELDTAGIDGDVDYLQ